MSNIRFLLINAINTQEKIETFIPNLGLGYIASSLRKAMPFRRGHSVEFRAIDNNIGKAIKEWRPDLVGITAVSQNYGKAMEYARIAKSFNLPVIMGGVHISALPQTLTDDMTVAVVGEGEKTIVDLIALWAAEGKFYNWHLKETEGVAFHDGDKLVITQPRQLIQPLDSIPLPARDLLKIDRCTSMFSSRGCPYRCTFCFSARFWNKVRFFSAEYVVEEIEFLHKTYRVKQISFLDDLFTADAKRLTNIVELLGKKDLLGKITFLCNTRSNLVTDELARLIRTMGVKTVGMGLESGCQATLEYLKGKNIKVQDHSRAIQTLLKHGITSHVSFIIGSPFEDRASIMETYQFIKDNRLTTNFDVYILTPFPGTPVWDYALSRNLVGDNMDWGRLEIKFNCNPNPIIVSEKLTEPEIRRLYHKMIDIRTKLAPRDMIHQGLNNPLAIPKNVLRRCANAIRG